MRPTLQQLRQRAQSLLRRIVAAAHRLLEALRARLPWGQPPREPQATAAPPVEPPPQAPRELPPPEPPPPEAASPAAPPRGQGRFDAGYFSHREGDRHYRLFVPPAMPERTLHPLLVMLHGCKQHAEDFAAGTQMNALARDLGLYVLYPEQPRSANMLRCWNWFKRRHQQRDSGEPAVLADLTREVMAEHPIDRRRVYVAGLSAGGAMAAILGHAYPDLFAAVGVHSGVPRGAAHDVASAVSAMKDAGASDHPWAHESFRHGGRPAAGEAPLPRVPTIVFHGDLDTTVHPRNAELVLQAALAGGDATVSPLAATETGLSAHGLRYTRTVYRVAGDGPALAEHWLVHGVGHAWSGGHATGSFTGPSGPDASREMWRFFEAHTLPSTALAEVAETA